MGNGCSKGGPKHVVIDPTTQPGQSQGGHRHRASVYENILGFEHSSNINRQYDSYFEYFDEYFGEGIKSAYAYCSKIPEKQIQKLRNEYWETRVTGKSEIWQCLRNACEADEETACAIITTMDIKLVNYSLQAAYDNLGNLYDVPIFCINDPIEYDLPEKINLQKEELSGETIKIKFRRSGVPNDVEAQVCNNVKGKDLKQEYRKKVKEENIKSLKLFFGGKEVMDDALIAEYGIQDDFVVQVMVKKE